MNLLRLQQYFLRVFHVYGKALPGNYTKKKLENIKELFVVANDFLRATEVEYWMDFGTLLGYHRESGIIPHDIDVDFCTSSASGSANIGNARLVIWRIS